MSNKNRLECCCDCAVKNKQDFNGLAYSFLADTSGYYYKALMIIIYVSRVINLSNLLVRMTIE